MTALLSHVAPQFKCIAADPPWGEFGGGRIKRGADKWYSLMSGADIAALPVGEVADPAGCHLWLWATDNHLLEGLDVMRAWGFRYVRTLCWGKVANGRPQIGLGQYLRSAHELCLFGVRGVLGPGGVKYGSKAAKGRPAVPSLVLAPRGEHSAKPAAAYAAIEAVSPGPRLELFARAPRPGWDVLGHGVGAGGDIGDDLRALARELPGQGRML